MRKLLCGVTSMPKKNKQVVMYWFRKLPPFIVPLSFIQPGCKKGHVDYGHKADMQTTYGGPWKEVDLEVRIDTFDIVYHTEDGSRGLVDVEAAERRVTADIVKAVDCCTWCISRLSEELSCKRDVPEAEKSDAPSGTRRYDRPAPPLPSVAIHERSGLHYNARHNDEQCLTVKKVAKN